MDNYREQDGCHNCKHTFIRKEYEECDEYFCIHNAPERPISGSVYMGENHGVGSNGRFDDVLFDEEMDRWDSWSRERKVVSCGICDTWEKKCEQ